VTRIEAKLRKLRAEGLTAAEIARRLHDELGLSAGEIAKATGESRQAMHAALRRTQPRGRPASGLVRLVISVPPETEQWIQEQAERTGTSLGDVVSNAIAVAAGTGGGENGRRNSRG
jgi:hypothetical protein